VGVGVRERECVNRDAYMAEILIHRLEIAYYVNNTHVLFSYIFTTLIREWGLSPRASLYINPGVGTVSKRITWRYSLYVCVCVCVCVCVYVPQLEYNNIHCGYPHFFHCGTRNGIDNQRSVGVIGSRISSCWHP